jgi:pimeloyl-ACP methyl ester carboxylesterase
LIVGAQLSPGEKITMAALNARQGYFRSRDGTRLFYREEGPLDGPPLLFCYGLVCSKLQWKYQMEHFSHQYRVIYMDYRGHGQSSVPDDPKSVTIEGCARDIIDLLDELKIPKAIVLGHSLGVNIILEVYRMAPQRVKALVLANGTAKDPFETMFHHNFLQVAFPLVHLAHGLAPDILKKFWSSQGTNPINQEFVARVGFNPKYANRSDIDEYLRLTSTVDLPIFLNLLEDFMRYDATHWLHQVKAPTLVLSGEKDLITPAKNQKIFARLIPHSSLYEVSEGSHCPQMEKPKEVNKVLADFFKKALTNKAPLRKKSASKQRNDQGRKTLSK